MITVYAIFIGIFLTSLLIVALNKASSFDIDGLKSYILLKRLKYKADIKDSSLRLIQNYYRQMRQKILFNKLIKNAIIVNKFVEMAISYIFEISKYHHEKDPTMMILKRNIIPIKSFRRFCKQ